MDLAPSSFLAIRRGPSQKSAALYLEPRVDWLALKSKDTEYAFVHAVKRLMRDEALEGLNAEAELAEGKRALVTETARPQPGQVSLSGVLRAVDDAQILASPAFDARRLSASRPSLLRPRA